MKCPTCMTADLIMAERQGIEIDYCPQCRGVWLDRGELDKIIERSHQTPQAASAAPPQPAPPMVQPVVVGHHGYVPPTSAPGPAPGPGFYWDGRKWKRKKSWFEEIFD